MQCIVVKNFEKDKIDIIGKHVTEVMPKFCDKIQSIAVDCPASEEIELEMGSGEKVIFAVRRTYYTDEKTKKQAGRKYYPYGHHQQKTYRYSSVNVTNSLSFNALNNLEVER